MKPEELAELGVYDPDGPEAGVRLELLGYLTELGATPEELVTFQDTLPALAGVLAIRGGPALTLEQTAERSGLTADEVRALARTAGIPDPEPDVPVFTAGFVQFAAGMAQVAGVFGEDAANQLIRVFGLAMSRIADAAISSFLVNVAPSAQTEDPVGLGVARANAQAASLLPLVGPALDTLFRQHLLIARRLTTSDTDVVGFETRQLVVGFVDLVGSTELGEILDMSELGATLSDFENIATETITEGGGRVVKLIGDEIMFTAPGCLRGRVDRHRPGRCLRRPSDRSPGACRPGQWRGHAPGRRCLGSRGESGQPGGQGGPSGGGGHHRRRGGRCRPPPLSVGHHHLNGIPGEVELYQLVRN